MPAELLAHVSIHSEVMKEKVALEDPVLFDHPEILLTHERLEDGGGNVWVVKAAQGVADVVQQRADDVFLVASADESGCGREGLGKSR
jgi:hypothetical protein